MSAQRGNSILSILILGGVIFGLIQLVPKLSPQVLSPVSNNTLTQATPTPPVKKMGSPTTRNNLEKYLTVEAALLGVSGNISYYFQDLDSPDSVSFEPERSWIPASTIKAYLTVEAYRQRNLGLINFNQMITIVPKNVVPTELETDDFPKLREGTKVSIKQLVEAMIIQSDNTAYNTLLDILDRRSVNNSLAQLGLTETVVGEKLNLDAAQYEQDLTVPGRQPNTTTAKDYATLFGLLYKKQIQSSDDILEVFKRQKINNMIPRLLPPDVVIAHKTGEWSSIYHDGGIIYRPNQPFIFVTFTNSNDPTVIAKLARVAYFQTADSVGKELSTLSNSKKIGLAQPPIQTNYVLDNADSLQVLGENMADSKFPEITAADLGISVSDISSDQRDAAKVTSSIILPGGLLYDLKRWIEDKTEPALIKQSSSRLSEAKSLLAQGNLTSAEKVLSESESNLKKLVDTTQGSKSSDQVLTQVQQVNDLHYAVLAEAADKVPVDKKEAFVDMVYNFYQKNHQEIQVQVQKSVIANPVGQKPAIGTIAEIKGNIATVSFDDGSKKEMVLNSSTPTRNFGEQDTTTTSSLKSGDKVAIIGSVTTDNKIIPRFVLKNVPKELPQKHEGTVIEIRPRDGVVEIKDQSGQNQEIKIDNKTVVKSKDTDVSLEGIKVGSKLTVFGQKEDSSKITPLPSINPNISQAVGPKISLTPTTKVQPTAPVKAPTQVIKATTITVTKNSSGKNEVSQPVETKKTEPTKAPETKPTSPAPTSAPIPTVKK